MRDVLFTAILIFFIFGGLFFLGNFCFSSCVDMCPEQGATECIDNDTYKVCEYDSYGCLNWLFTEDCDPVYQCGGGTCADDEWITNSFCSESTGTCIYYCERSPTCCGDECSVEYQQRCTIDNRIESCTDCDYDTCLEWCEIGNCSILSTECGGAGCNDRERPSWFCVEIPIDGSAICNYNCVYIGPGCCDDECPEEGLTECHDTDTKKICGYFDSDSCLDWKYELCIGDTSCGYDDCDSFQKPIWYCSGGICAYRCSRDSSCEGPVCQDECSAYDKRCSGDIAQTCAYCDDDICLDWCDKENCSLLNSNCGWFDCLETQRPEFYCDTNIMSCNYNCISDSSCNGSNGGEDECSFSGKSECLDNISRRICGNYDSDPYLEWSAPEFCAGNTSCSYGSCYDNERPNWFCSGGFCYYNCVEDSTCSSSGDNECNFSGETRCYNNNSKQICDYYYDSDPYLEWSSPQSCIGDSSCGYQDCVDNQRPNWYCSGGECSYNCFDDSSCNNKDPACEDECPQRWLTECVDNSLVRVCGYYYDTDDCLEWYAPEICSGDVLCGYENCDDNQKPSWYCNQSTNQCDYNCVENADCVSDYVKNFRKECYDNDVYWFDSEDVKQDKFEECDDNNPDTIDVCQNVQCSHRSSEEEYCETQEHCGDGICNCDEDMYTCFDDCEITEVSISIFSKEDKEWKESISAGPEEKIEILLIILNQSRFELSNVLVEVELPQEIVYKGDLKIDNVSSKANFLEQGVSIDSLVSNTEKRITFKAEIAKEAAIDTNLEINASVEVEDTYNSDKLGINITKPDRGLGSILKWLVSRWYLWLVLWVGFVAFLYWILRRSNT